MGAVGVEGMLGSTKGTARSAGGWKVGRVLVMILGGGRDLVGGER